MFRLVKVPIKQAVFSWIMLSSLGSVGAALIQTRRRYSVSCYFKINIKASEHSNFNLLSGGRGLMKYQDKGAILYLAYDFLRE